MIRRPTAVVVAALLLAGCASSRPASSPSEPPAATSTASATAAPTPTAAPPTTPTPAPTPAPRSWSRIDAGGPTAREDHTWTVDPVSGTALLFGGRDGGTVFADLWSFDLQSETWTELRPPPGPAARFGHEAVWVDATGLVVFGGQAGATFFNDLWAYDPAGDAWSELPNGGEVPTARYGTCAAMGPDGRLWISHGFTSDGVRFADTKAYDFGSNTWTDETPTVGARPVERCLHACWWTDDGALALFAGQTTGVTALDDRWTLDDGAWRAVSGNVPPARNLYARARLAGGTLIFGGQGVDGSYLGDLWFMSDGDADAEQVHVEAGPAGRAGAEMVTDTESDRVLLFGGRDLDGANAETWELTSAASVGG